MATSPSPVRRTTMQHVDETAIKYFETLNRAQMLYMNGMRIALDPLHSGSCASPPPADAAVQPQDSLKVDLRVDVASWTTAQLTLSVMLSPTNTKTFVFHAGSEPPFIPLSARRSTLVSAQYYSDGQKIASEEGRGWIVERALSDKKSLDDGPVMISSSSEEVVRDEKRSLTILLRSGSRAFTFNIPFATYEAEDVACAPDATGYTTSNAFDHFNTLLKDPLMAPWRPRSVVSATDAEALLSDVEESVLKVKSIFDSVFLTTARQEFGPQHADDVLRTVDWSKSYTVASDVLVQDLIAHTKKLYQVLTVASNTAVEASWLQNSLAREIMCSRQQLAQSVQGRRTDLSSVARVRCAFMCIDAIDNAMRHACRLPDSEQTQADEMSAALEIPCHGYWLQQTKNNLHNSVTLDEQTLSEGVELVSKCKNIRDGRKLLPTPVTAALQSRLGGAVWQSMHLQGLAADHPLPFAPCAHFMYKQRARVDYTAHPVVAAAEVPTVPLALLTMLVCTDVEHRIIPPRLGLHILTLLQAATGKDATSDSKQQASDFLQRILDPSLHSLATAALAAGAHESYDMSFTDGHLQDTTGYKLSEVSAFCMQDVL